MSLLLLALIGALSIAIPFGIFKLNGQIPLSIRNYVKMLALGTLICFLIKSLSEAGNQSVFELPFKLDSWAQDQQWLSIAGTLVVGLFLGLAAPAVLFRSKNPASTTFWAALGMGFYNLSQCFTSDRLYIPPYYQISPRSLSVLILHSLALSLAVLPAFSPKEKHPRTRQLISFALIATAPYCYKLFGGVFWTASPDPVLYLSVTSGILLYVLIDILKKADPELFKEGLLALLAVGFLFGWYVESVPINTRPVLSKIGDPDGDKNFRALPWLPLLPGDVKDQDEASNDVLHEKAMRPKLLPDGTKEYDLTASAFTWQLYDNARVTAWGYNGQVPGPILRFKVGDKVSIVVTNRLPQPTSVHWHGLAVPNQADGVPRVTQKAIEPGQTYTYHFVVTPQMIGTHLYHSHVNDDFQVNQGLHGVLIVDPAAAKPEPNTVDATYEIASWKVMDSEVENLFLLDGKAYPEAPALRVPLGAKVRLRLVNASAESSHVMHLHGYTFKIVALDGNPLATPISVNTVSLAPSQTADVVLVANNPGTWMFHCHILDHMINPGPGGDGSDKKIPEMGGLVTYLSVQPGGKTENDYLPACSLMFDPTCSKP